MCRRAQKLYRPALIPAIYRALDALELLIGSNIVVSAFIGSGRATLPAARRAAGQRRKGWLPVERRTPPVGTGSGGFRLRKRPCRQRRRKPRKVRLDTPRRFSEMLFSSLIFYYLFCFADEGVRQNAHVKSIKQNVKPEAAFSRLQAI